MTEIKKINTPLAAENAASIKETANSMYEIFESSNVIVKSTSATWEGQSAESFANSFAKFSEVFGPFKEKINEIGIFIDTVVESSEQDEKDISAASGELSYISTSDSVSTSGTNGTPSNSGTPAFLGDHDSVEEMYKSDQQKIFDNMGTSNENATITNPNFAVTDTVINFGQGETPQVTLDDPNNTLADIANNN